MRIDIRVFNEQGQLLYQSHQAVQAGRELLVFPDLPLSDRASHARLSGLKIVPLFAQRTPHSFDPVTGLCVRCGLAKSACLDQVVPDAPLSPADDAMLRALEEAPDSVFLDQAVEAAFVKKLHPSHDWQRPRPTALERVCTRCGASEVVTRFPRGAEPCPLAQLPEPTFEIDVPLTPEK